MTNALSMARLLACLLIGLIAARGRAAEWNVSPNEVVLKDAYDGRQLLVADGGRDATRAAKYASSDGHVVQVDAHGYLRPVGDGAATIGVRGGKTELTVPVRVSGCKGGRPVDFKTEIQPLLSRLGCNSGGCHGKSGGQNGFQLSLFGFDAAFDYDAITREARGRRIFPAAPTNSLVLRKASGQAPHGGGKRLN